MSLQNEVLRVFEQNRGVFFSGQELATKFEVSRNAVWKVVQTLKSHGHTISSGTNKGYMLEDCSSVISSHSIEKYLVNKGFYTIEVEDVVSSTNAVLKSRAASGGSGTVLVAMSQTAGRGRQDRNFSSPHGGVYSSILLKPSFALADNTFLTALAGTAAASAIEEISQKQTKIKWVNDVLIDGKKVSGILTEAEIDVEDGRYKYVVIGIGINVTTPKGGFGELDKIATAMFLEECAPDTASKLIALVLDKFFDFYTKLPSCTFIDEYRKRQIVVGEDVELFHGETFFCEGRVDDVNEHCELVVQFADGTVQNIASGEARIKRRA